MLSPSLKLFISGNIFISMLKRPRVKFSRLPPRIPSFDGAFPLFQGFRFSKPSPGQSTLNLGLILPHSIYNEREYNKAVTRTISEMQRLQRSKSDKGQKVFTFMDKFAFTHSQVHRIMMKVNPSPTGKFPYSEIGKMSLPIEYLPTMHPFRLASPNSIFPSSFFAFLACPVERAREREAA